jgi:hypothetical protein
MDRRLQALRRRAYDDCRNIDAIWQYARALERAGSFGTQFPNCGTTTVACHVLTEEDGIHPRLYDFLCVQGWNLCLTASPDIWVTSPDVVEDYDEWIRHHFYDESFNPPFRGIVPKHLMIDLENTWPGVVRLLDSIHSSDQIGTEDIFWEDGVFHREAYLDHQETFINLVNSYYQAGYKYLILDFSLFDFVTINHNESVLSG